MIFPVAIAAAIVAALAAVSAAPVDTVYSAQVAHTERFSAISGLAGAETTVGGANATVPAFSTNYTYATGGPVRVESVIVLGDSWSNATVAAEDFFYYEYFSQLVLNASASWNTTLVASFAQPKANATALATQAANATALFKSWNATGEQETYADALAVVFVGVEDYRAGAAVSDVVAKIVKTVETLYAGGARTFALVGQPDYGTLGVSGLLANVSAAHNLALSQALVAKVDTLVGAHSVFVNVSSLGNDLLDGSTQVADASGNALLPAAHATIAAKVVTAFADRYGHCEQCAW